MKNIFTFLSLVFLLTEANAQTTVTLDANNVKALIPSTPLLFYDGTNAVFKVPKAGTAGSIFSASPWIAGNSNSTLYLAGEMYRQIGTDYQNGPVSNSYATPTKWNVVKVTKAEIDAFKNDSSIWANPPASFLKWPAHGDTTLGQPYQLAPFVNQGGDPSLYEPSFGDYPAIKGDVCSYYIFNDDKAHTESLGTALKVDIHRMVYEYADTTKSFLNNAVFVEYKIVNRSSRTYTDGIFTVYTDFDLGNYSDDYIGSDSVKQMMYCYNGDDDDSPNGYGVNPPAQGMILLNQKLASGMFYQNDSTKMGNPNTAEQVYNYMTAIWRDFTHLKYGGNGTTGTVNANFAFSGNPCQAAGWTEASASMAPGDRRSLGNIAMPTLTPNESFQVTYAYLYARGNSGAVSSVCSLQQEAASLIDYYQSTLAGVGDVRTGNFTASLYPNPSHESFQIQCEKRMENIEVYALNGALVKQIQPNQNTAKISGLEGGLYFVKVTTLEGVKILKALIK